MDRGIFVPETGAEQITIAEGLQRYLTEVSSKKAPSTEEGEIKKSRQLTAQLGDYTLTTLKPDIIAKYRDKRLKTVKPNTVRLELALLAHMYTTAIQEWQVGLGLNPVQAIAKPRLPRGRDRRLLPMEERRLFLALEKLRNPSLKWIVRLALETAMRKGEILNLKARDVHLGRGIVIVRDHDERGRAKSPREVPLTVEAENVLQEAIKRKAPVLDSQYIFFGEPNKDGERNPYEMGKAWNDTVKRVGLKNFHFHDLRHEAVSSLVEAGFSDQVVSTISGHQSMQMLKRYANLRGGDLVTRLRESKKVQNGGNT